MFSLKGIHFVQMMMVLFGFGGLFISSNAYSEDVSKSKYMYCKNGREVRTIRVEQKGQSCRAIYTKEGNDQVVGKSGTADVCFDIASKIRINLEAGNWKCKNISETRVSSSLD